MHPNTSLKPKPRPLQLSNSQVEQLIAMRETQTGLKERLRLMDEAVEKSESELIRLLDSGVDLSACGYELNIQVSERRFPKWKEEFVSQNGKVAADAVIATTPVTVYRKLMVSK